MSESTHLRRIDPDRNMARFYTMSVQPTLFCDWALFQEWGRIGSAGRLVSRRFAFEQEAAGHGGTPQGKAQQRLSAEIASRLEGAMNVCAFDLLAYFLRHGAVLNGAAPRAAPPRPAPKKPREPTSLVAVSLTAPKACERCSPACADER